MPRLNIYVPDDLHELATTWRGTKNLSAICAEALREELEATDAFRAPGLLLDHLRGSSEQERDLAARHGLAEAIICKEPVDPSDLRTNLGEAAARYLDRNLGDGSVLGIAGGRQTWCVVRQLSPRRIRLTLAAIGTAQNDPQVLHAHPNTLVTLLSLIYAPRAEAHLVGAPAFRELWNRSGRRGHSDPRLFVLASTAPFDPTSPYAGVLGNAVSRQLVEAGAIGDVAGVFMYPDGRVDGLSGLSDASLLDPGTLVGLARRPDARVIVVAGGSKKRGVTEAALRARLCNVLITDPSLARTL